MKAHSRHYLKRSPDELQKLTKKAFFSFDSSVLLDLYRYPDNLRKQFFSILEAHKSRLWLTHQAADEFFSNRLDVISQMRERHESVNKLVDAAINKLKNELNGLCASHPHLNSAKLGQLLDDAAVKAKREAKKRSSSHPRLSDDTRDDPIMRKILALFRGRVGPGFTDSELFAALQEAELRFKNGIPPGFTDKDKASNAAGDFLVWKQLIQLGLERRAPIFFVISEKKIDWWIKKFGELHVSPKLRKEFYEKTGQEFVLYHSSQFAQIFLPKTKQGSTALKEIVDVEKSRQAEEQVAASRSLWGDQLIASLPIGIPEYALNPLEKLYANYNALGQFFVNSELAKQLEGLNRYTSQFYSSLHPFSKPEDSLTKAIRAALAGESVGKPQNAPSESGSADAEDNADTQKPSGDQKK